MVKGEKKESTEQKSDFTNAAVGQALNQLRQEHGLEVGADYLFKYLNIDQINDRIQELRKSQEYIDLAPKQKNKFLYDSIVKYIVEHQPFNEKGKRLLEGSLESLVQEKPSFWKNIFRYNESEEQRRARGKEAWRNHYGTVETAEEISYLINKNRELYSEAPQLAKATEGFQHSIAMSKLADIMYSSAQLPKELYKSIKQSTQKSAQQIVNVAKDSLENYVSPKTAYATAFIGILMIFFSGTNITGFAIGSSTTQTSIFTFIGIALIFVSCLLLLFKCKTK
ncbi:MAG TPA: hypothetical protein VJB35_00040 [Candidatus Nanoarchaeia archaeon]|nr:hypothetical protein [Candidatus Nanoarchaeia archaeon]